MNSKQKISVAMCTFNGESFLREQLESIRVQTFPPSELVVCDDCSKDRTLEILYAFKESCNFPVIVIANTTNIGVNKNFENAIAHCSSEFIALADQDDIWLPTKIEEIINTFKANPNCGYVFSNADLVDSDGEYLGRDLWKSIKFTPQRYRKYTDNDQLEVMLRDGNFIYGMTMAFRSVYKPILLPIESQTYACTHDSWIGLILSGIGAYGVAVSKSLVKYRQHERQLAGGGRQLSFFELLENALKKKSEIDMAFVDALMSIAERLRSEGQNKVFVAFSINQLIQKALHLKSRCLAGTSSGLKKITIVLRESVTGRYGQYSGSKKSIFKDLFSRNETVIVPHTHEPYDTNNSAKKPNFFVVGAAKAGTSSIGDYLSRHPSVYISPIKEPHFFSKDIRMADFRADYRERAFFDVEAYLKNHPLPHKHIAHIDDESQYLELFREVKNEKAIGELSAGYLYSNCAAENLFKFNPDARIVMVLRQPVERAYSHYLMDVRDLWSCDSGFINALERDFASSEKGWGKSHLYVELGLYFEQVSRYLKRFPESQVKIFLYEDFKNDPVGFIQELCEFLEVAPSALSAKDVAEHKNVAALPRFKIPGACLPVLNVFRKYTGMLLPDKIKPQIRKVMFSSKNVPKLREDEFEQTMKYFSEDIQKLSVLIKRDLQSWHQMSK